MASITLENFCLQMACRSWISTEVYFKVIRNCVTKCYYVSNYTMFDRNKGLQIKLKIVEIDKDSNCNTLCNTLCSLVTKGCVNLEKFYHRWIGTTKYTQTWGLTLSKITQETVFENTQNKSTNAVQNPFLILLWIHAKIMIVGAIYKVSRFYDSMNKSDLRNSHFDFKSWI